MSNIVLQCYEDTKLLLLCFSHHDDLCQNLILRHTVEVPYVEYYITNVCRN